MSVDTPAGPSSAQIQALVDAGKSTGGSGCAPILLGFKLEVDMASPFTCKGKGLNSDAMIMRTAQAQPGFIRKLLKEMGCTSEDIMAGMQKVAQAGPVQQINSIADVFGNCAIGDGGGSFAPSGGSNFAAPVGRSDSGGGWSVD